MITVETLQAEVDKYRKEQLQMVANANALDGAIQAFEALISKENNSIPESSGMPAMITRETIRDQVGKYRQELDQARANTNALEGAIQAIVALISKEKDAISKSSTTEMGA